MEERDVDRPRTTLAEAKRLRPTHSLRVARQGATTTFSDQQKYERLGARIADLIVSGRVVQGHLEEELPNGKTVWRIAPRCGTKGTEADVAEFLDHYQKRRAVERRLGPERLPAGLPLHIHHNGIGYVIHPYWAWLGEWLPTFGCFPRVGDQWLNTRDEIVWFVWHFRKKALILTGPLSSKVRFFTNQCVNCGRRYSPFGPRRLEKLPLRCPSCGHGATRDITPTINPRPFGTITKIALRNRFRISQRKLEWILSAKLARFPDQTSST